MIEAQTQTTTVPAPEPLYLTGRRDAVFVTYHAAAAADPSPTAVVLCPPFGWDEVSSYRCLRRWASSLADAGYPTLRLSYPSTGDSGGEPRDPARVEAWVSAVADGVSVLRSRSDCERLTAIGLGLGGMLAYLAAADGAAIDDLVLWAAPARGRSLIRELTVFSRLVRSQIFADTPDPEPPAANELDAGGFLLSATTLTELRGLDLTAHPLPRRVGRRALLLDRDGVATEADLRATLTASGVTLTVAPGPGFAAMTSNPQHASPPLETWATVRRWLDAADQPAAEDGANPVGRQADWFGLTAEPSAEIRTSSGHVRETPVVFTESEPRLSGVLVEPVSEPLDCPAVVMLNAGAIRRIGPNRMWVEAARRWADRGLRVLRLDVAGIGDSEGDSEPYRVDAGLYVPELVPQALGALDALSARGWGERYVLVGLCSGAYWSFHALLRDDRVRAAVLINPRALVWDTDLRPAREFRELASKPLTVGRAWRALRSPARLRGVARALRWRLGSPSRWRLSGRLTVAQRRGVDAVLDQLAGITGRALLVFSDGEPLARELSESGGLARLDDLSHVRVERIPIRDHELRPLSSQRRAHALLDAAIEAELAG